KKRKITGNLISSPRDALLRRKRKSERTGSTPEGTGSTGSTSSGDAEAENLNFMDDDADQVRGRTGSTPEGTGSTGSSSSGDAEAENLNFMDDDADQVQHAENLNLAHADADADAGNLISSQVDGENLNSGGVPVAPDEVQLDSD